MVTVIVGAWDCLANGKWHFSIEGNCFGKCVDIVDGERFEAVKSKIVKLFGVNLEEEDMFLTFWYEGQDTVFTQQRMPPVAVECDSGLSSFMNKLKEKPGLNLFLTRRRKGNVGIFGDSEELNEGGMDVVDLGGEDISVLAAYNIALEGHLAGKDFMKDIVPMEPNIMSDDYLVDIPLTFEDEDFLETVDNIVMEHGLVGKKIAVDEMCNSSGSNNFSEDSIIGGHWSKRSTKEMR